MTWFIMLPLMVAAIVIAVLPVSIGSIHQDRTMRAGIPDPEDQDRSKSS